MEVWTLMIKLMIKQREFQLKVWTLIIQMSTVIPPSSMVLFNVWFGSNLWTNVFNNNNNNKDVMISPQLFISIICISNPSNSGAAL